MFDIRQLLHFADAVGMPRQALLPLILSDAQAGQAVSAETCTVIDEPCQQDCGGLAATGLAAGALFNNIPQAMNASHVKYWHACTEVLYIRDRLVGGTALLPSALQQWQRVSLALKKCNVAQPDCQLLSAAAEVALCTGWIAISGGRLQLAKPLYKRARELAVSLEDPLMAVHLLISQSMLYAEMAHAGPSRASAFRALRLAYRAAEEGRYIPMTRLHALIALRHASAASLLGDKAAFQRAIRQARRELGRSYREDDTPQWLRFVSETEVTEVEAKGYRNLGMVGSSASSYRHLTVELSHRDNAG